ncbi:hypothetical protein D917_09362, partial [Trichinella nativa]
IPPQPPPHYDAYRNLTLTIPLIDEELQLPPFIVDESDEDDLLDPAPVVIQGGHAKQAPPPPPPPPPPPQPSSQSSNFYPAPASHKERPHLSKKMIGPVVPSSVSSREKNSSVVYSGAVIQAKPQLRNMMQEAIRLIPTAVRMKRDKEQQGNKNANAAGT